MSSVPKSTKSPYITVKKSSIHNKGVFARKDIPKGTRIIEYVGEKVTKAEGNRRQWASMDKSRKNSRNGAVYIFELNKKTDIDGGVRWNTARLINHSCDPNCETKITRGRIWIVAIKDIKKGEEISYNYNYDLDDFIEHPCRCRSRNCVGYILNEDEWCKIPFFLKRNKVAGIKK